MAPLVAWATPLWAPSVAAHTLSHVVGSLEWPRGAEAKGGAGRLGVPGFPPPRSPSSFSGP